MYLPCQNANHKSKTFVFLPITKDNKVYPDPYGKEKLQKS